MGAKAYIRGNLGGNPELKFRDVQTKSGNEEKRSVCEFSVYQSHRRLNKETGEYEDNGGFWVEVSVWGKEAEGLAKVLSKGYPVAVTGELYSWNWSDKNEQERQSFKLDADRGGVSLLLHNVDNVVMRVSQQTSTGTDEQKTDDSLD